MEDKVKRTWRMPWKSGCLAIYRKSGSLKSLRQDPGDTKKAYVGVLLASIAYIDIHELQSTFPI